MTRLELARVVVTSPAIEAGVKASRCARLGAGGLDGVIQCAGEAAPEAEG